MGEVPSQGNEEWGGDILRQGSSSPEQRIVEADKRCQKRLAVLARDHIIKLREERERMAYNNNNNNNNLFLLNGQFTFHTQRL